MPMKPTMIQLPADLIADLDRHAEIEDASRSELIRRAIRAYLQGTQRHELEARYQDAYGRFPLDTPDEWGDLVSWSEAARRARHPT